MADDMDGGGEGSEVARAYVNIGATTTDLMRTVGGLPATLASPLARTNADIQKAIGDTIDSTLMNSLKGRFGQAITAIGQTAVNTVAGTVKGIFTRILGETIGGWIGTLAINPVQKFLNNIFAGAGSIVDAATGPLRRAMQNNLLDFSLWTERSIEAETAQTRFSAILRASGEAAGWNANQLRIMASQLSSVGGASMYSTQEIQKAQTALLGMQNVRGDTFYQTLKTAMDLAAYKGIELTQAVHILGHALDEPEHGYMRLRREADLTFTEAEKAAIRSAHTIEEAQRIILTKTADHLKGVASAMAGTTEGMLAGIRNKWNEIGRSIGDIFLPVTKFLTGAGKGLLDWLGGALGPVLQDIKGWVSGVVGSVQGFIDQNKASFAAWGEYVKEIFRNVWDLAKDAFGAMFNQLGGMEGVQSTFEKIDTGIQSILQGVRDITGSWSAMSAAGAVAWIYVRNKFMDFVDSISQASTWKGVWDFLKSSFVSVLDWMKGTFGPFLLQLGEKFATVLLAALHGAVQATGMMPETEAKLKHQMEQRQAREYRSATAEEALGTEGPARQKKEADIQGEIDRDNSLIAENTKKRAELQQKIKEATAAFNSDLVRKYGNQIDLIDQSVADQKEAVAFYEKLLADLKAGKKPGQFSSPVAGGGGEAKDPAKEARDKELKDAMDKLAAEMQKNADKANQGREVDAAIAGFNAGRGGGIGKPNAAPAGETKDSAARTLGGAHLYEDIRSKIQGSWQQKQVDISKEQLDVQKKTLEAIQQLLRKDPAPGVPLVFVG